MSSKESISVYPRLKFLDPGGGEKLFEACAPTTLIGRSNDADVTLLDRLTSRRHAQIVKVGEGYSIEDLQSRHGTYVNGEKVDRCSLKHGDKIRVGGMELQFVAHPQDGTVSTWGDITAGDALKKSLAQLTSVMASVEPEGHSELEKVRCILDLQIHWGQHFSSERTFQQILKSALEISGAGRGFVLEKKKDEFSFAAGMNARGQALSQTEFSASQTVVSRVVDSQQAVFRTQEIGGQLAKSESVVGMGLQAVACLPLRGNSPRSEQTETLGIRYLDSTYRMHELSELDRKILTKLAAEAGSVLERLKFLELDEERKEMERQLAAAHDIYVSLLPETLPEFSSFQICAISEPTHHVGGDFYDFLLPDAGQQLLGVLADVSGKGIPAALLSSMVQGALDGECRAGGSLGQILDNVNRLVLGRSRPQDFVTLFLFSIDAEGKGEYISAGHNPAYLFRASNGSIEELSSNTGILGMFDSLTFESLPLKLDTGDRLIVYSDGLTEATNPADEMFGEERLRKIISGDPSGGPRDLEQKVLASLEEFTEGMPQMDDVTLMIVQNGA